MKRILLTMIFGCALIFAGCGSAATEDEPAEAADETVAAEPAETTAAAEGSALPQNVGDLAEIYSFTVNGTKIALPTDLEGMRALGVSLDGYVTTDVVHPETITGISLYDDSQNDLKVDLYGNDDTDVSLDEAKVISIDLSEEDAAALGFDFTAANGLTFGDSIDEAIRLYGGEKKEDSNGVYVCCRFTNLMAEQGLIGEDEVLSPSFEGYSIFADANGNINRFKLTYCPAE